MQRERDGEGEGEITGAERDKKEGIIGGKNGVK